MKVFTRIFLMRVANPEGGFFGPRSHLPLLSEVISLSKQICSNIIPFCYPVWVWLSCALTILFQLQVDFCLFQVVTLLQVSKSWVELQFTVGIFSPMRKIT